MGNVILDLCLIAAVCMATMLVWAPSLFLGALAGNLRDQQAGHYSKSRLWLAAAAIAAIHALIAVAWLLSPTTSLPVFGAGLLLTLALVAILPTLVIKTTFKASVVRALLAWIVAATPAYGFALFVVPFASKAVVKNYVVPTNSMAPTILGYHWTAKCEECGAPCYCTAVDPSQPGYDRFQPTMICENFHATQPPVIDRENVGSADRIVARLGKEPRRWELIVFRFPEDPSEEYVARLVGLPGETITIREGAVWADGKKLEPPKELEGVEYESQLSYRPGWGDPKKPAVLGDDEYFVLGDNTQGSKDSRFWEFGAEGHSPYAVPREYIRGVVTHCYWPLDRARRF